MKECSVMQETKLLNRYGLLLKLMLLEYKATRRLGRLKGLKAGLLDGKADSAALRNSLKGELRSLLWQRRLIRSQLMAALKQQC